MADESYVVVTDDLYRYTQTEFMSRMHRFVDDVGRALNVADPGNIREGDPLPYSTAVGDAFDVLTSMLANLPTYGLMTRAAEADKARALAREQS